MSLYSRKRLHAYNWTKVPIDDKVISRVEKLAKAEGQPQLVDGLPIFEWDVGSPIINNGFDENENYTMNEHTVNNLSALDLEARKEQANDEETAAGGPQHEEDDAASLHSSSSGSGMFEERPAEITNDSVDKDFMNVTPVPYIEDADDKESGTEVAANVSEWDYSYESEEQHRSSNMSNSYNQECNYSMDIKEMIQQAEHQLEEEM